MYEYTQHDFTLQFIKEINGRPRKSSGQVDRCGLFSCIKCGSEKELVLSTAVRNTSGLCVKCASKNGHNIIDNLTQEHLKDKFRYDSATGLFTRINNARKVVGTMNKAGYLVITIGYKRYMAHHLAWLYEYGYFPEVQIDHKDHNRSNNAIDNLREVTELENSKSKRLYKVNTSGHHGVIWDKINNNWRARIGLNGKTINLGSFEDKGDAIAARVAAEHEYDFHENHGGSL